VTLTLTLCVCACLCVCVLRSCTCYPLTFVPTATIPHSNHPFVTLTLILYVYACVCVCVCVCAQIVHLLPSDLRSNSNHSAQQSSFCDPDPNPMCVHACVCALRSCTCCPLTSLQRSCWWPWCTGEVADVLFRVGADVLIRVGADALIRVVHR